MMPDTADLRRIAEAATPGPWELDDGAIWVREREWIEAPNVREPIIDTGYSRSPYAAWDAAYIAAWNPARALAALKVIEAAEAHLDPHDIRHRHDDLRAALREWREA